MYYEKIWNCGEVHLCDLPADGVLYQKVRNVKEEGGGGKRSQGPQYVCLYPSCHENGKMWRNFRYFSKHWNDSHASPDDMKVQCPDCDRRFITKGVLALHAHSMHKRAVSCSICGKQVWSLTQFYSVDFSQSNNGVNM